MEAAVENTIADHCEFGRWRLAGQLPAPSPHPSLKGGREKNEGTASDPKSHTAQIAAGATTTATRHRPPRCRKSRAVEGEGIACRRGWCRLLLSSTSPPLPYLGWMPSSFSPTPRSDPPAEKTRRDPIDEEEDWRRRRGIPYSWTVLTLPLPPLFLFQAGAHTLAALPLDEAIALLQGVLGWTKHSRGRPGARKRRSRGRGSAMLWAARVSGFFSAAMLMVVLSPSLQSFPPAEAIRSSQFSSHVGFPGQIAGGARGLAFRRAPFFLNAADCGTGTGNVCDSSLVHIAITLDDDYLRGSVAAVHSVVQHAMCPESVFFHFLVSDQSLGDLVRAVFPQIRFKIYYFDPERVRGLISSSVRQALEQPLNYARNYLADLLEPCVHRVIYLDSDLVLVDDVAKLWRNNLGGRTVGAPEYCHANFTKYFTSRFWSEQQFAGIFTGRRPCYFNTGVMVLDLARWRHAGYTRRIERWMEIQKSPPGRIYELGSLPPFLLVFAGHVAPIEHRWNQHGLGGDNILGSCRDLHPGPVSLLHWSGSGKPWARLGAGWPCPLDALWAPFDLYGPAAVESSR